jgi:hypothetical protein
MRRQPGNTLQMGNVDETTVESRIVAKGLVSRFVRSDLQPQEHVRASGAKDDFVRPSGQDSMRLGHPAAGYAVRRTANVSGTTEGSDCQ